MSKEAPFNPPYSPEQWDELKSKTTAEERLVWAIFNSYPPIEEIIRRTPEEVEMLQAEAKSRALKRHSNWNKEI